MFYNIDLRKTSVVGLLAAAMALVMSFMFVGVAKANEPTPTDAEHFEWEVENGEIAITNYKESGPKDVVIPSEIDGVTVKSIKSGSFAFKGLTSVYIPKTIQKFECCVFYGDGETLKEMTIKNSEIDLVVDSDLYGKVSIFYAESMHFEDISEDLTLYGYPGSTTEGFANDNNITFVSLVEPDTTEGTVDVKTSADPGPLTLTVEDKTLKGSATIDVTEGNLVYSSLGSFVYTVTDNRGIKDAQPKVVLSMSPFIHEDGETLLNKFTAKFENKDDFAIENGEEKLDIITLNNGSVGLHKEDVLTLNELIFNYGDEFIKAGNYSSTITLEVQNVGTP